MFFVYPTKKFPILVLRTKKNLFFTKNNTKTF